MTDTEKLDPRLRKGLTVTVADLVGVLMTHYSYDRTCPVCGTHGGPCPSWRVAQPLLYERRAEDHSVSIPDGLLKALRHKLPTPRPAPPAPPPATEELFDAAPYYVPKKAGRRARA